MLVRSVQSGAMNKIGEAVLMSEITAETTWAINSRLPTS